MPSWARARIVAYGDGRLSADSAGGPIGAAALPRSSGSQSMTMRVLAGVRPTGEEGEGGAGAGDASMGESGGWDVRGAVTALRLRTVQLCRVSDDFSTRATGGDFEASFAFA
jgi:hypothetical protein